MLKKVKSLLVIVLLLFTATAHGQVYMPSFKYYKAELTYIVNGKSEMGYAIIPKGFSKKVSFKKTPDDKPMKINSDELHNIKIEIEGGDTFVFERASVKMTYVFGSGEMKSTISKQKSWLFREYTNPKMNFYMGGQVYKIRNNGELIVESKGQAGFVGIGYYLKRPKETEVTYIAAKMTGFQMGEEERFRKVTSMYFNDDKELSKKIENNEFTGEQVIDIYNEYITK